MAAYFEIKKYLEAHRHASIGQFGIDWIERTLDEWDERERADDRSDTLTLDDDTMTAATHYTADTLLEVLRDDAPCRPFFEGLSRLTSGRGMLTAAKVEEWRRADACPECGGAGRVVIGCAVSRAVAPPCPKCGGSGSSVVRLGGRRIRGVAPNASA